MLQIIREWIFRRFTLDLICTQTEIHFVAIGITVAFSAPREQPKAELTQKYGIDSRRCYPRDLASTRLRSSKEIGEVLSLTRERLSCFRSGIRSVAGCPRGEKKKNLAFSGRVPPFFLSLSVAVFLPFPFLLCLCSFFPRRICSFSFVFFF